MYSPKIREDLIERLYHLAKTRRVPMTRLVDELLETALDKIEGEVNDPPADYQSTQSQSKGGGQ